MCSRQLYNPAQMTATTSVECNRSASSGHHNKTLKPPQHENNLEQDRERKSVKILYHWRFFVPGDKESVHPTTAKISSPLSIRAQPTGSMENGDPSAALYRVASCGYNTSVPHLYHPCGRIGKNVNLLLASHFRWRTATTDISYIRASIALVCATDFVKIPQHIHTAQA